MMSGAVTSSSLANPIVFAQSGVGIGFERISLKDAKLRYVQNGKFIDWEVIIYPKNDYKAQGSVVMPWGNLPQYTRLGSRDQALYDAIDQLASVTPNPIEIRNARLTVDSIKNSSINIRDQALAELNSNSELWKLTYIEFMLKIMSNVGFSGLSSYEFENHNNSQIQSLSSVEKNYAKIRSVEGAFFSLIADRNGLKQIDNKNLVESIVNFIAPFDFFSKNSKFLHCYPNTVKRILKFSEDIMNWKSNDLPEINELIKFIVEYANISVEIVEESAPLIHKLFNSLDFSSEKTSEYITKINNLFLRVSYALDGWDRLIDTLSKLGELSKLQEKVETFNYMCFLISNMPIFYIWGAKVNNKKSIISYNMQRRVRAYFSWTQNTLDEDLLGRISRMNDANASSDQGKDSVVRRRR